MAKEYLPDSYLRKRQRDARLRLVRDWAMYIIVAAAAVGLGTLVYFKWILPHKQGNAGVTEQMAEHRQQLADRQSEQQASNTGANPSVGNTPDDGSANDSLLQMSETDLSSLNYTSSFPLINVSVETGASGDQRAVAPADNTGDNAEEASNDGSDVKNTSPESSNAAAGNTATPETTKPPKQEDKPEQKPEKKPEEIKPAESKPAEPPSTEVTFKVYAGSHFTRDDAERQVKDLSALGLSGTVIEAKPNFLVFVGSFSGFEEAAALRDRLKASGFSAFASKTKK